MKTQFCKDPCDKKICKGTNAVCNVIYETGEATCECPQGMQGDPMDKCGKYSEKRNTNI